MFYSDTFIVYKAQLRYFLTDFVNLMVFFLQMRPEIALTNTYLKEIIVIGHPGYSQMILYCVLISYLVIQGLI